MNVPLSYDPDDLEPTLDRLLREVNQNLLWPFQVTGYIEDGGHFAIFSCDVPAYGIFCPMPAKLRKRFLWDTMLTDGIRRRAIVNAGYACLKQGNDLALIPSFEDYYNPLEKTP